MTYFELFGIPVQLNPDTRALRSRFFELSRALHPDFYAQASAAEQEAALERSALLNKAWKTFQQTEDTVKYVLQLKGLLEEEEKYPLAPDFLMEVMDINEALMDPEEADLAALNQQLTQLQHEIYAPVQQVVEGYQEGITSEKELLQVKDWYYRKKYLDRISRQLAGMK